MRLGSVGGLSGKSTKKPLYGFVAPAEESSADSNDPRSLGGRGSAQSTPRSSKLAADPLRTLVGRSRGTWPYIEVASF